LTAHPIRNIETTHAGGVRKIARANLRSGWMAKNSRAAPRDATNATAEYRERPMISTADLLVGE
jgi:hypothetical protein